MSLVNATASNDPAESLRTLAMRLAEEIDACDDARNLPQLARQYRETMRALSEIDVQVDDEIESIVGGLENVR